MATKRSMFDLSDDEDFVAAACATPNKTESEAEPQPAKAMTTDQSARAEKNRLKAVALKKARLMTALDSGIQAPKHITGEDPKEPSNKETGKKETIDTGAGFFIDEDDEAFGGAADGPVLNEKPAPIVEPDQPSCLECKENFGESYLLRNFDYEVCDKFRDTERDGKHELITKTDAVKAWLVFCPLCSKKICLTKAQSISWNGTPVFILSQD